MKQLPVGDILEWVGAVLVAAAAFLLFAAPGALVVGGAWFLYCAQCYDRPPRRPGERR